MPAITLLPTERLAAPAAVPAKQPLLGIGVSPTDYEQVAALCRHWVDERTAGQSRITRARWTAILSVHSLMTAYFDPHYRALLNSADLATPDGMPVVWALRSFGVSGQRRVYGPDLMMVICEQAARLGHRVYLYGGTEATLTRLVARLEQQFPSLRIAGKWSPPFRPLTPVEENDAIQRIRSSRADIVFVGIGAPKQERWMARHAAGLPGVAMFGVGAAFDFHSGTMRQAPGWMRASGLEWLFRLRMEPRRLWKRYLLNPLYLVLWGLQWAGLLRYPESSGRADSDPGTWEEHDGQLTLAVGTLHCRTFRFRALRLDKHFTRLSPEPGRLHPPFEQFPEARAAIVESHPVVNRLHTISLVPGAIRYARSQYRRFLVSLDNTWSGYLKDNFEGSRRNHLRRTQRRFADVCGGALQWRMDDTADGILEFHRLARIVSAKTYQEKLASAGLPDDDAFRSELPGRAARGWVRGYLLFHGDRPVAYTYCVCDAGVITCELMGYDPEYRDHRVGNILLCLMLESLFAEGRFRWFDFGKGEFAYKEFFSTSHMLCADLYFFRRTLRNVVLVAGHFAVEGSWACIAALLDRMGLRQRLKTLVCRLAAGRSN